MPTPFSPELYFWIPATFAVLFAGACVAILNLAHRTHRMCDKLLDANRTLAMTIAHPLAAARLEQKRQATEDGKHRKTVLSDVFGHQGRQRQTRHKQDRAANPLLVPRAPALRFVPLDGDIVPPRVREKLTYDEGGNVTGKEKFPPEQEKPE